jgi:hypothetical protein
MTSWPAMFAAATTEGATTLKTLLTISTALVLTACSTGVVPTGQDTYMIAKKSAAGVFTSGATVKATLYTEANDYCARDGRVVETITATSANAIPFARMPQAELNFKCVPKVTSAATAASAPQ